MIAASSPRKSTGLEDRRRVFYVALTRTTETLIQSSETFIPVQQAYEMRLGVAGGAVLASRFMKELKRLVHAEIIAAW